jgi:hypothetical protein
MSGFFRDSTRSKVFSTPTSRNAACCGVLAGRDERGYPMQPTRRWSFRPSMPFLEVGRRQYVPRARRRDCRGLQGTRNVWGGFHARSHAIPVIGRICELVAGSAGSCKSTADRACDLQAGCSSRRARPRRPTGMAESAARSSARWLVLTMVRAPPLMRYSRRLVTNPAGTVLWRCVNRMIGMPGHA